MKKGGTVKKTVEKCARTCSDEDEKEAKKAVENEGRKRGKEEEQTRPFVGITKECISGSPSNIITVPEVVIWGLETVNMLPDKWSMRCRTVTGLRRGGV